VGEEVVGDGEVGCLSGDLQDREMARCASEHIFRVGGDELYNTKVVAADCNLKRRALHVVTSVGLVSGWQSRKKAVSTWHLFTA